MDTRAGCEGPSGESGERTHTVGGEFLGDCKYRIAKLPLPEPPAVFIQPRLTRDGIESLPIEHRHVCRVAELPDHHRDPFDRLLVAVAQLESLTLVTTDPAFEHYDVQLLMT